MEFVVAPTPHLGTPCAQSEGVLPLQPDNLKVDELDAYIEGVPTETQDEPAPDTIQDIEYEELPSEVDEDEEMSPSQELKPPDHAVITEECEVYIPPWQETQIQDDDGSPPSSPLSEETHYTPSPSKKAPREWITPPAGSLPPRRSSP